MITDLLGAQRSVQRPRDRGEFELEPADALDRGATRIEPGCETADEAGAKITREQRPLVGRSEERGARGAATVLERISESARRAATLH